MYVIIKLCIFNCYWLSYHTPFKFLDDSHRISQLVFVHFTVHIVVDFFPYITFYYINWFVLLVRFPHSRLLSVSMLKELDTTFTGLHSISLCFQPIIFTIWTKFILCRFILISTKWGWRISIWKYHLFDFTNKLLCLIDIMMASLNNYLHELLILCLQILNLCFLLKFYILELFDFEREGLG